MALFGSSFCLFFPKWLAQKITDQRVNKQKIRVGPAEKKKFTPGAENFYG